MSSTFQAWMETERSSTPFNPPIPNSPAPLPPPPPPPPVVLLPPTPPLSLSPMALPPPTPPQLPIMEVPQTSSPTTDELLNANNIQRQFTNDYLVPIMMQQMMFHLPLPNFPAPLPPPTIMPPPQPAMKLLLPPPPPMSVMKLVPPPPRPAMMLLPRQSITPLLPQLNKQQMPFNSYGPSSQTFARPLSQPFTAMAMGASVTGPINRSQPPMQSNWVTKGSSSNFKTTRLNTQTRKRTNKNNKKRSGKKNPDTEKELPKPPYDQIDIELAYSLEVEFRPNPANQIVIRFPDPDLNPYIVRTFRSGIKWVYFPDPYKPRYCIIEVADGINVQEYIDNLNTVKFDGQYLKAELKTPGEEGNLTAEGINPYMLHVGNLPYYTSSRMMRERFLQYARFDMGYSTNSRYAKVRFNSVHDAVEAFKANVNSMVHARSISLRYRRVSARKKDHEVPLEKCSEEVGKCRSKKDGKCSTTRPFPEKQWNKSDAEYALFAEGEFHRTNKQITITFPDSDISPEFVKNLRSGIKSVYFPVPYEHRYCVIQVDDDENVQQVIDDLNQFLFNGQYLKAELKAIKEEIDPDEINPYMLYVGNLPFTVTLEMLMKRFKRQNEVLITFSKKMTKFKIAWIEFQDVFEAVEAYKANVNTVIESRSIVVRFKRTGKSMNQPGKVCSKKNETVEARTEFCDETRGLEEGTIKAIKRPAEEQLKYEPKSKWQTEAEYRRTNSNTEMTKFFKSDIKPMYYGASYEPSFQADYERFFKGQNFKTEVKTEKEEKITPGKNYPWYSPLVTGQVDEQFLKQKHHDSLFEMKSFLRNMSTQKGANGLGDEDYKLDIKDLVKVSIKKERLRGYQDEIPPMNSAIDSKITVGNMVDMKITAPVGGVKSEKKDTKENVTSEMKIITILKDFYAELVHVKNVSIAQKQEPTTSGTIVKIPKNADAELASFFEWFLILVKQWDSQPESGSPDSLTKLRIDLNELCDTFGYQRVRELDLIELRKLASAVSSLASSEDKTELKPFHCKSELDAIKEETAGPGPYAMSQ